MSQNPQTKSPQTSIPPIQMPLAQIPGVYHRRIGDILVTALSDGYLSGDVDILRNIEHGDARAMLAANFSPERRTHINAFVLRIGGRTALIETGAGDYMQASSGKMMGNLLAAGIDPVAIDTVLLTHMHPDHSAGLTNMADNSKNFPNAELVVHANEPKHWLDDAAMSQADERATRLYFQATREQIAPYRNQSRYFEKTAEVFPGVTAIPAMGHTPGHSCFLVESAGDRLLIWGDLVHVPEIQVVRPEVAIAFDTDIDGAIAARRRIFDMAASEGMLVAGMHLHFPAFSYLTRDAGSYRLIPEPWAFNL
jgi:glyoxylase-like metal-dependent hydrolase (beta-lactamase superfamily II)